MGREYKIIQIMLSAFWLMMLGCGESPTVDLYAVAALYPKVIEPGDVLVVKGEGFIEGKARIVLDGTAKPMGHRPARPFHRSLYGTAISENHIEVPVTAYLMDYIARESLQFDGVATVSFPEIQLDSAVSLSGKSPVQRLEFRPTGGGVKIHALKMREAKKMMKELGLLLEASDTDESVVVTGVIQDSVAEHARVSEGARLISIDEFPLFGLDELAGLDMSEPHILEFMLPEGTSLKFKTNPSLNAVDLDEFTAILLTSLVLGFFLAFVLPMRRTKVLVVSTASQNPIPFVVGYGVAALITVIFPAVVIEGALNLSGTIILVAILLICIAVILIYGPQSLARRLSHALGNLFSVCAIILMGGAAGNNLGLSALVQAQSTSLFGFHVFENPLTMLSTLLVISLLWPGSFTEKCSPYIQVAAWLQSICGAMLVVFFCLGGWIVPGISPMAHAGNIWLLLFALIVFFAKTWLVLTAARQLGGAGNLERREYTAVSGAYQLRWVVLPILVSGAIYLVLNPVGGEVQSAGQILSSGIFCTLFSLFCFSRVIKQYQQNLQV